MRRSHRRSMAPPKPARCRCAGDAEPAMPRSRVRIIASCSSSSTASPLTQAASSDATLESGESGSATTTRRSRTAVVPQFHAGSATRTADITTITSDIQAYLANDPITIVTTQVRRPDPTSWSCSAAAMTTVGVQYLDRGQSTSTAAILRRRAMSRGCRIPTNTARQAWPRTSRSARCGYGLGADRAPRTPATACAAGATRACRRRRRARCRRRSRPVRAATRRIA